MTERADEPLHRLAERGARPAIFCGYCGARPSEGGGEVSRVCAQCHLGLLLRADDDLAPGVDEAFVVVDDVLALRAVSRRAERLLAISETAAVDRQLGELLVPADALADDAALRAAMLHALAGAAPFSMTVRPRATYGVRYAARVGPCAPGPAALVVLTAIG